MKRSTYLMFLMFGIGSALLTGMSLILHDSGVPAGTVFTIEIVHLGIFSAVALVAILMNESRKQTCRAEVAA